ncbi:MAG: tRNA preQ1(34) S-adenosylmethionine ribosyltransferase-isomerase QueA [Chloroflexota bacterium]|nr:MAG: tRNA preQ1(34) S-adenosylmethionine ribosyltransferase-isomerase QueA [Chloroflexota bacterium]
MKTDDFDYDLPKRLIAQQPAVRRDGSRLMVLNRQRHSIQHDYFHNIGAHLCAGDLLVANRSKVIPARLHALKDTGGAVELLLLRRDGDRWMTLARPSRRLQLGTVLQVSNSSLEARLEARAGDGRWLVSFAGGEDIETQLRGAGSIPLPPYIKSLNGHAGRYQTVYADDEGSVAAPTAGMHFSRELIASLETRGVRLVYVTLHVGLGTFRPVTVDVIEEHAMHPEWGEVPSETAGDVNEAHDDSRRVIAVGTTTTRLLESAVRNHLVGAFRGDTARFIYPGFRFQAIDGLITNFHLPRSTLLMLVSAFAGRQFVLEAYREAVECEYRFFSFGDAMLIL